MKVALSQRPQDGAWGGGNNFVLSLLEGLHLRGHEIVFSLEDPDIDVIVMTDPRARNPLVMFTPGQILRYLHTNSQALVVHRINECDERKRTKSMNRRLRLANYAADHTVFIASWLKGLNLWAHESGHSVVLNGADTEIFDSDGNLPWDGHGPLRLVTHHWGANRMKGFDVYENIDSMLDDPKWRDRLSFTYVGNLPQGAKFQNIRHLEPLSGAPLASELRRHHAYFTASINEPAGMHHIEGALCGLPLIYRMSGGLPEYCEGFGEPFTGPEDFDIAIERMMTHYDQWRSSIIHYPHKAERMVAGYIDLFENILARRDVIITQRRLWRNPFIFLLNQLPI